MRAFVITGPRQASVLEVPPPVAAAGQVVVDVTRAGVCGTDVEFFTGEMAYLHQGYTHYPVRIGHEWCGEVTAVGDGVDPEWVGRRVTGDTMLGCGRCRLCRSGRHHVCRDRSEIGIRGRFPGALAEQLAVPVAALHPLPDDLDDVLGALVEPAGNAVRAVDSAGLLAGDRLLVLGSGAIGLLAGQIATARGIQVHIGGRDAGSLDFADGLGFAGIHLSDQLPGLPWDGVIDATNSPAVPALALDLVEPGGRVVYIGLAGVPSAIDTRALVLSDVTAVGILGASTGLPGAIEAFGSGSVDARSLVGAVVGLDGVAQVLAGGRPVGAGPGPKIQVDPRV